MKNRLDAMPSAAPGNDDRKKALAWFLDTMKDYTEYSEFTENEARELEASCRTIREALSATPAAGNDVVKAANEIWQTLRIADQRIRYLGSLCDGRHQVSNDKVFLPAVRASMALCEALTATPVNVPEGYIVVRETDHYMRLPGSTTERGVMSYYNAYMALKMDHDRLLNTPEPTQTSQQPVDVTQPAAWEALCEFNKAIKEDSASRYAMVARRYYPQIRDGLEALQSWLEEIRNQKEAK